MKKALERIARDIELLESNLDMIEFLEFMKTIPHGKTDHVSLNISPNGGSIWVQIKPFKTLVHGTFHQKPNKEAIEFIKKELCLQ